MNISGIKLNNTGSKPVLQKTTGMVTRAMSGKDTGNCAILNLIAEITQLRICQLIQVKPANVGTDVTPAECLPDILQDAHDSGMRAAAENDKTTARVNYEALFMEKPVRKISFLVSDIEIIASGNGGTVCLPVRNKPYSVCYFIYSGNISDAVMKSAEKAFLYPDIFQ